MGKTPGRERSKNHQTVVNKLTAKGLTFAKNPFQFESPLVANAKSGQTNMGSHLSNFLQAASNTSTPNSIWNSSNGGVTFSDVVAAQNQLPDLVKPVMNKPKMDASSMSLSRRLQQDQSAGLYNRSPMDVKASSNKRNSADLGPIGPRRRSPNLNWEPMGGGIGAPLQNPTPTGGGTGIFSGLSRSRFLDSFQARNQSSVEQQMLLGGDNPSLMTSYSYFDDPSVLLAMYNRQQQQQQQQQAQAQQQAQQQQQQQQQIDAGGWSTSSSSSMWTPMGYSNYPQQQQHIQQHQQQQPTTGMWPIRPPPGLADNLPSNNNSQLHHLHQQQQQQMRHQQQQQEDEMRTYDPFKSVSYLWQGNNDPWGSSDGKKQQ